MAKEFLIGDRVRISENHHWAKRALAIVAEPPAAVAEMVNGWEGAWRTVEAVKGPLRFYWVEFEQPQRDADGDGPYGGAEIDSEYLLLAEG